MSSKNNELNYREHQYSETVSKQLGNLDPNLIDNKKKHPRINCHDISTASKASVATLTSSLQKMTYQVIHVPPGTLGVTLMKDERGVCVFSKSSEKTDLRVNDVIIRIGKFSIKEIDDATTALSSSTDTTRFICVKRVDGSEAQTCTSSDSSVTGVTSLTLASATDEDSNNEKQQQPSTNAVSEPPFSPVPYDELHFQNSNPESLPMSIGTILIGNTSFASGEFNCPQNLNSVFNDFKNLDTFDLSEDLDLSVDENEMAISFEIEGSPGQSSPVQQSLDSSANSVQGIPSQNASYGTYQDGRENISTSGTQNTDMLHPHAVYQDQQYLARTDNHTSYLLPIMNHNQFPPHALNQDQQYFPRTSYITPNVQPTENHNQYPTPIWNHDPNHQLSWNDTQDLQPFWNHATNHQPSWNDTRGLQPSSNDARNLQPSWNHATNHQPSWNHAQNLQPSWNHATNHQPSWNHATNHQYSKNHARDLQPFWNHAQDPRPIWKEPPIIMNNALNMPSTENFAQYHQPPAKKRRYDAEYSKTYYETQKDELARVRKKPKDDLTPEEIATLEKAEKKKLEIQRI